jgi:uncharacterized repeat protein (TIGR03803 family)
MNMPKILRFLALGLLWMTCIVPVRAQSLSVLHQFTAANDDGASPYSELTLGADGVLYGTTWGGGTNAAGTIFRINTNGSGFALLHHFGNDDDGSSPFDGVIQAADGFLYGTTYYGGTNENGTVFKINTNGSAYSVIYRFTNSPDGANPYGGLVQGPDGSLYGTTTAGGSGPGIVFKISTDGSHFAVLHSFTNFTDATIPYGRLVQASNGILYGTTLQGGPNILGAVFQINTNGLNYSILHGFGGPSDGFATQSGLLLGKDGWLYGTTISGGAAGFGTVFKLSTNGVTYATLRSFTNSPDGANSYARVAQGSDGFLYGTTSSGGNTNTGTIFRMNTNGANYSVLYRFNGNGDGQNPRAGLFTPGNGVFYGTALIGGATNVAGFGTLFRFGSASPVSIGIFFQSTPFLTLTGAVGQACQVQLSSNLYDWTVFTNVTLTNGTAQIPDPTWTNSSKRFYRTLVP